MQSLFAERTERRMTCNTFNVTRRLAERRDMGGFKPDPDRIDARIFHICNSGRELGFLEIKEVERRLGCTIKLKSRPDVTEKCEYRIERSAPLTPEQGMVLLEHGLEVIY